MSLNKTHKLFLVVVTNKQEGVAPSIHDWKFVDLSVKHTVSLQCSSYYRKDLFRIPQFDIILFIISKNYG